MRGALSVRIDDGRRDQMVTADSSGLTFSKIAPGGHESLSVRINRPRSAFPDLGPADRAYVYDTRTGRCVFDGYTANPAPVDGAAGQSFDLSAVGGMTLAADETRSLIYLTRDVTSWVKDLNAAASANFETIKDPAGRPGLRVQLTDSGGAVATGGAAGTAYLDAQAAGMQIGALRAVIMSGKTDINYRTELYTSGGGVQTIGDAQAMNGAAIDQTFYVGNHFPPSDVVSLILRRTGAPTNIADDLTWANFYGICVLGRRMDRTGTLLTGAGQLGSAQSLFAHQVVEDVLGRLLPHACDPAAALVVPTDWPITQLAWPDGATAQRVLDELARFHPEMLWEILDSTAGGHRFAYRPWPTEPRYEISTRDGYRETGSDDDLRNRIHITWTDATGAKQTLAVTATSADYPALEALERSGRTSDADAISLEDGYGSPENALRIGQQKLAAINDAATAATAVVRRRIYDHLTGAWVYPWEIDPGYLVRVRETGGNLRMTRMAYDDDACASSLTLGEPVLTDEQRIARLANVA